MRYQFASVTTAQGKDVVINRDQIVCVVDPEIKGVGCCIHMTSGQRFELKHEVIDLRDFLNKDQ